MTSAPVNNNSSFIPTTNVFPADQEQLIVRLTSTYAQTATAVNAKQSGIYDQSEILNGQQFFDPNNTGNRRQAFRKVFSFDDTSLVFNHNISDITLCTDIYGAATNGTVFFPVPYVDVTNVNNQIMITVSATQITIVKGAGAPPAITNGVVILEYLKN